MRRQTSPPVVEVQALPVPGLWLQRLRLPGAILLVAASAALGLWWERAPAVPIGDAQPGGFSVRRASADIARIAAEPRPTGSPAAQEARRYIEQELRQIGLPPVEQRAMRIRAVGPGRATLDRARNLVARLDGGAPGHGAAVLLMAHYDSIHSGPGAADDGAGVATLLEAARALGSGPAVRNDVLFLFTDAEESSMAGAELFAAEHPWTRDVRVVLNFEARGTSGPSLLFETSPGNGWLIQQFARSAPFPRASSLYAEIYRAMPNDTDLSVFLRRGVPGLNFAFVEQPGRYHTSGDTPAALDRASLYHHGENGVAMARALANADLSALAAPDVVYFNLGNWLIVYSPFVRWALALVLIVALAALTAFAMRSREVAAGALVLGVIGAIAAGVMACAVAFGLARLRYWMAPAFTGPSLRLYVNGAYQMALILICIASLLASLAVMRRRLSRHAIVLGGSIVGVLAALALTYAVPGASYLLAWPALLQLACATLLLRHGDRVFWGRPGGDVVPAPARDAAAAVFAALPCVVLVAPVVFIFFVAFGMDAMLPAAALVTLTLVLMMPLLLVVTAAWPRRSALTTALAATACVAIGIAVTRTGTEWPRYGSVFYARNLDDGKAVWATRARSSDPWMATFLGAAPRRGGALSCLADSGPFLFAPAPVLANAASPAEVAIDGHESSGGTRRFVLRIHAARDAGLVLVNPAPKDPPVFLSGIGEIATGTSRREPFVLLNARAVADDETLVRFETTSTAAVRFTLFESVDRLPLDRDRPRPPGMVRGGEGRLFNDATLSCRTLTIPALDSSPPRASP